MQPNAAGMASDAVALARRIGVGINIGNALEANGGETARGNPRITPALIRLIRQSGFTAVRLPTSWDQYADPRTRQIGDAWLARVKQVVQWCVDDGLYVIVNIHRDGGWLDNHITASAQAAVTARQKGTGNRSPRRCAASTNTCCSPAPTNRRRRMRTRWRS